MVKVFGRVIFEFDPGSGFRSKTRTRVSSKSGPGYFSKHKNCETKNKIKCLFYLDALAAKFGRTLNAEKENFFIKIYKLAARDFYSLFALVHELFILGVTHARSYSHTHKKYAHALSLPLSLSQLWQSHSLPISHSRMQR